MSKSKHKQIIQGTLFPPFKANPVAKPTSHLNKNFLPHWNTLGEATINGEPIKNLVAEFRRVKNTEEKYVNGKSSGSLFKDSEELRDFLSECLRSFSKSRGRV